MATYPRFTSADLDALPQSEGTRYEIIDGELYVSRQPHYHHQYACSQLHIELGLWNRQSGLGVVVEVPGLVFDDGNDVIPDLIWMSRARREHALDAAGHLTVPPELVVEVLSYRLRNESRDREAKLKLYSVQGVHEYWIVDWRQQRVQVYRRQDAALQLAATWRAPTISAHHSCPASPCRSPGCGSQALGPTPAEKPDAD